MDWEQQRYGAEGVEVIFTPRAQFAGRPAIQELLAQAGVALRVRALWLMGEDDPYPGEWALGHVDRRSDLLGRAWLASGDVSLPPNVGAKQAPTT